MGRVASYPKVLPLVPLKEIIAKTTITLSAVAANQSAEIHSVAQKGLFTHYLIEGLRGKADLDSDRTIALDELFKYLSVHVARDAKKQNREQNPLLRIAGRDDSKRIMLVNGIEQ